MLRTIAIWGFGLTASAIVGLLIGAVLMEQGAGLGLIAGLALFVCVRLMLTMPRYPRASQPETNNAAPFLEAASHNAADRNGVSPTNRVVSEL
jgi:hypothetical protein